MQAASLLPQLVLQQQQQPDVLLPQLFNLNPQLAGPFNPQGPQLFLPNQGNQLTPVVVPNGQQDQPGPPLDPSNPNVAQQGMNPVQVSHCLNCCVNHDRNGFSSLCYSIRCSHNTSTPSVDFLHNRYKVKKKKKQKKK